MNCFDFTTLDLAGGPRARVAVEEVLDLEAAERLGGILDGRSIGASRKERAGRVRKILRLNYTRTTGIFI